MVGSGLRALDRCRKKPPFPFSSRDAGMVCCDSSMGSRHRKRQPSRHPTAILNFDGILTDASLDKQDREGAHGNDHE